MADSVYPGALDTDVQIPRIDDNITEIGGEAINGLRSAIFNIQEALGLNPQGTTADLATRLNVSINPDGSLKASALAAIGLVTLPITNSQIASNAGIEESKLDLDYSTVALRTLIANLEVFANAINTNLLQDIGNLNQHVSHPSAYGRHQTRDVDGYVGKFANHSLQGIITEIDDVLTDHVDTGKTGAHSGENVSVDDSFLNINASNMQQAVEELDNLQDTLLIQHRDDFHSNGILRAQDVFLDGYSHAGEKVSFAAINSVTAGDNFVQYTAVPAELASVARGDIIEISSGAQTFRFYVDNADASTGQVDLFGKVPTSITGGTAAVYAQTDETNALSNLILTRRQSNVIQMVHPGAPFVFSHRADPRKITTSVNRIRFRWHDGETGDIDVKSALETYVSTKPSAWTVENLVTALNETFRSASPRNYFPLIAFHYKGEFGVAYDEAVDDAYVEVVTPNLSANSAASVLGLVEGTLNYGLGPRKTSIDGYQLSTIRQKIESTGQATGNSIDTFPVGVDVLGSGLQAGDLVRVFGGTNANNKGSFVVNSVSAASMTFVPSPGFVSEFVSFRAWEDTFGLAVSPSIPTLYELFADGYNTQEIRLLGAKRMTCQQAVSSTENMEQVFDIVDVSRNFSAADRRIYFDLSANTLTLGQQGVSDTLLADTEGEPVELPSSAPTAPGFRFKLYDNNNIDYVEIVVANANYLNFLSDAALDIEVFNRISEEKFLQLGIVLHNTIELRHLSDRRLFGNVGRADIRDDFTRDYISYPASMLRSKGVLYGMSVQERSDGNIDAYGGEVFVDGSVAVVATRDIGIPQDGEATTYNLFVEGGRLQLLRNDQTLGINGTIIQTPSISEILSSNDKLLIAQIDTNASNTIIEIRDYRRFINNLDDKMELIVEENTITNGAFPTLRGALNWISAMDTAELPVSRVIKVRGIIDVDISDGSLTIPDGVTIKGDVATIDASVARPTINIIGTGNNPFTVSDGVAFENLLFTCDAGAGISDSFLVGTNVSNITLRGCYFDNLCSSSGQLYVVNGSTTLADCLMDNCYFNSDTYSGYFILGLFVSSGTVSSCSFYNTTLKNTVADVAPGFVFASSNITDILMVGCEADYSLANTSNTVIQGISLTNITITSCELDLGINDGSLEGMLSANSMDSIVMSNNIISYASTNSNNYIVNCAAGLTNCIITNNCFATIGTVVSALTGTDIQLSNNVVNGLEDDLISVPTLTRSSVAGNTLNAMVGSLFTSTTTTDVVVRGNVAEKTDAGSYGITVSTLATRMTIGENILNCTGVTGASFDMINVDDSVDLVIAGNVLKSSGAGGLRAAIATSSGGDGATISNNIINGFTQNSPGVGKSISINDASYVSIVGNRINEGARGIEIDGCNEVVVANNTVEVSTGLNALRIEGTGGRVVVSGNIFTSTNTSNADSLVDFTNANADINMFGNTCSVSHTGTEGANSIINSIADNLVVSDNIFRSLSGGDYSIAAITTTGTTDVVKLNDLRDISYVGGSSIISIASTAFDYMNWGQEYTIYVPLMDAWPSNDNTFDGTIPWRSWSDTNFYITDSELSSSSGSARIYHPITGHVPYGATLTDVTIGYERSGADVDKCSVNFFLKKLTAPFAAGSDLWASATATDTSGSTVTVSLSPSNVVNYGDGVELETYVVRTGPNSSTGWEFRYRGITVTYTL